MEYRLFELDSGTWRIEEYDHRSSVYMYLLTGRDRALLVDTGFGTIPLGQIVAGLTDLPVLVLCTHAHFDHIGGNALFENVYMHRADRALYRLQRNAGPEERVRWFDGTPDIDLGDRPLRLLHTPGHSLGSVCLLDVRRRWLFTGDTCCKADVLLNLDYSTTVEEYARTIRQLRQRAGEFDWTWPAHHAVPVEPSILDQFDRAAGLLRGGAQGEAIDFPLGRAWRLTCGDVAIVYTPERIHERQ